jgi:hypothetical protein
MRRSWSRTCGALAAAILLAAAWLPGTAAAEPRQRGVGRGPVVDDAERIEQAAEAAGRAGVRRRDLRELRELCERGEFSTAQTVRVLNLATQLALEELPVESFLAKIGEGVSKGVQPARIVQVAEKRALMLNRAKSILNGVLLDGAPVRDREELIPDVAEALEGGQTADGVRKALAAGFTAGDSIGEIRKRMFP